MRVKDLISELKRLDPEARVVVNSGSNELDNGKEARNVFVGEALHYKGEGANAVWRPAEYYEFDSEDMSKAEVVVNITSARES